MQLSQHSVFHRSREEEKRRETYIFIYSQRQKLARKHENTLRQVFYLKSATCFKLFFCLRFDRNVYVVVVPLRRARGVIRHLKSPDEMDLEEVRTTTMTAPTDVCAWKEERLKTHTHTRTLNTGA